MRSSLSLPCLRLLFVGLTLVLPQSVSSEGEVCEEALGLQDGSLPDASFSASSYYSSWEPWKARLNRTDGWRASSADSDQYLRLDLGRLTQVTALTVRGVRYGEYPMQMRLFYSLDGLVWQKYLYKNIDDSLPGTTSWDVVKNVTLNPPIVTRHLAVNPFKYYSRPALRLEVFGCPSTLTTPLRNTTISQDILDNRAWLPSESPYVISGPITVRPGGHLTIEPGVTVIFTSENAGLNVMGRLEATGMQGLPVTMEAPLPPLRAGAHWQGVVLYQGGNLSLDRVEVRHAKTAVTGTGEQLSLRRSSFFLNDLGLNITAGSGSLPLEGVVVDRNRVNGMLVRAVGDATLTIRNSIFSENGEDGMDVPQSVNLTLHNCTVSGNGRHGVQFYSGNLNMENCNISSNGYHGFYVRYVTSFHIRRCVFLGNRRCGLNAETYASSNAQQLIIQFSVFQDNGDFGIRLYLNRLREGSACHISDSAIIGNGRSVYVRFSAIQDSNFTFSGTNVTGPTKDPYYESVTIDMGYVYDTQNVSFSGNRLINLSNAVRIIGQPAQGSHQLQFFNNIFSGTNGNYVVRVDSFEEAVISDNTFVNNTSPIVLQVGSWRIQVTNNVFQNPQATHDLAIVANGNRFVTMDASRNFWGVTTPLDVRNRVNDFYYNMDRPRAVISPFFLDADLQDLSGSGEGGDFSSDQTRGLGGILTSDLTIGGTSQSLRIGRNLVVPRNMTLTLSAGLALNFSAGIGILVEGTLIVEGKANDGVILQRSEPAEWEGIVANSSDIRIQHALIQGANTGLKVIEASAQTIHLDNVTITSCSYGLANTRDIGGTFHLRALGSKLLSPVEVHSCLLRLNASFLYTDVISDYSKNFYFTVGRLDFLMAHSSLNTTRRPASFEACPYDSRNAWEQGGNITFLNTTVRVSSRSWGGEGLNLAGSYYNSTLVRMASEPSGTNITWDFMNVALEDCELEAQDSIVPLLVRVQGIFSSVSIVRSRFRGPKQLLLLDLKTFPATSVLVANNSLLGGESSYYYGAVHLASQTFLTHTVHFLDNTLANCSGDVIVLNKCPASLHGNIFLNPEAVYNLKVESGGPVEDVVNATYNYWGSRDPRDVSRRVYDSDDNVSVRKVAFIPFYEDSELRKLAQQDSTFVGTNSTVGGQVGGNITLTAGGSPYLVVSSILVDSTDRLTIEAGVTLLFMPGLTLKVKGKLYVQGSADKPVKMIPAVNGSKWIGVFLVGKLLPPGEWLRSRVRLMGGQDEREGRVEVKQDDSWTTVCDDRFDVDDAKVVCAMLGFDPEGGVEVYKGAHFGQTYGGVYSGYEHCQGQEPSGTQWTDSLRSCSHTEDVGVRCLGNVTDPNFATSQNEVQMENVFVNDTSYGVIACGNVTRMVNLTSSYSGSLGVHLPNRGNERPPLHVKGLTVNNSVSHGVRILGVSGRRAPPMTFSDCHVEAANGNGVMSQYSTNITLERCNVSRCGGTGVEASGYPFGHLHLSASSFRNNGQSGAMAVRIDSQTYNYDAILLNVTGCNFTLYKRRYSWQQGYIIYGNFFSRSRVEIRKNTFQSNDAAVYLVSSSSYQFLSLNISENSFLENQGTAIQVTPNARDLMFRLEGNAFRGCTTSISQSLVQLDFNRVSNLNASVINNIFTNNSVGEVLSLAGKDSELAVPVQVSRNRLQDNRGQAALATSVFSLQAHFNVFHNPAMDCELAPPAFQPRLSLNASLNVWGVSSPVQVARRTCGFDVDMTQGYVEYLPFLTSLDPEVVSSNRHDDFFLPGALGGDVLSEVRLEPVGSPFYVQRSVFVRKGGQLRVPGGVEMRFAEGTGLYVEGHLLLGDNSSRPTRLSGQSGRPWHGVVLARNTEVESKTTSEVKSEVSQLVGVVMENAVSGLTLDREAELVGVRINNSLKEGLIVKEGVPDVLDLGGLTVESSGGQGVRVEGRQRSLTLGNFTVRNSSADGLVWNGDQHQLLIIQDAILDNNSGHGFLVESVNNDFPTTTVRRSRFLNHQQQKAVLLLQRGSYGLSHSVQIRDCHFLNNTAGSLEIRFETYSNRYQSFSFNVSVENNVFERDAGVSVVTRGLENITLTDNVFRHGNAGQQCYLLVDKDGSDFSPEERVVLSYNTFQNISAACVVRLKTSNNGSFLYSLLETSTASQGVVLLESPHFNFSHNRFYNPESTYELRVAVRGNGTVPAMNNWWGTGTGAEARRRVLDRRQETGLLEVLMEPRLPTPDFDCSQVKNCSQHGECVRPSGCRCQTGWEGEACDQVSCVEVNRCSSHGTCMGPNVCACSEGWKGRSCSSATCLNVGNCGNGERGFCVLPDQCRCLTQFKGSDCSECALNHWGANCLPCPRCVHGICNLETGGCVCSGDNWAGTLCERCAEAFYGEDCGPYTTVLHVLPSSSPDTGGVQVHVRGHNFPPAPSGNYTCRFGTQTVTGERLGEDHVVCRSPRLPAGVVHLEVSADGLTFTTNKTAFTIFESCPPSACGREFVPRRGRCHFGECVCSLPWSGPDCDVELLPPVISPVNPLQTLVEGVPYTLQLNLTQGEPPITWTLVSGPEYLEVGGATGLVRWVWPAGSDGIYTVEVRATNRLGASRVTWNLRVPMTYRVEVNGVEPAEAVLPGPRTLTVKGSVVFLPDVPANITTLVLVEVRNQARNQTVQVAVRPPKKDFQVQLFPHPADSGLFLLDARHPGVSTFEAKVSREVQALRCVPPVTSVRGYLDPLGQIAFPRLALLLNGGLRPLHNVTVTMLGVQYPMTSAWIVVNDASVTHGDVVVTSLGAGTNVAFGFRMQAALPGRYQLNLEFRSSLGTATAMTVTILAEIRTPRLVLKPGTLSASVERGSQRSLQVEVENVGEAEASNVRVLLPDGESRLALAAFSRNDDVSTTDATDVTSDVSSESPSLTLGQGESASLTVIVTAGPTEPLGELRGSIAVRADSASVSLPYVIYMTSSATAGLSIRVEDEYTYFAQESPLVTEVEVTLRNPRRGLTLTSFTSNSSGLVEFEEVPEDRYTLSAKAPGHAPYTSVILLSPDKPRLTIFLRRVAVRYTWTVTPTTYEDKYVIQLDSTFEASVPMPVVTVKPMTVDLTPYELGQRDTMEFVITNHGLIQAENVRFAFPSHPELTFVPEGGPLGNLAANSTIVTSVRVTPRTRRRRATRECTSLVMPLNFDIFCGSNRTSSVPVTITRECDEDDAGPSPPRRPKPGYGPGGYYGPSGDGNPNSFNMTYQAVTPLSCDCLKNLFQKCLLDFFPKLDCGLKLFTGDSLWDTLWDTCLPAWFPVVGCANSFLDFGDKVEERGAMGIVWGTLDIGMSCLLGSKVKLGGGSKGKGGSTSSSSGSSGTGSGSSSSTEKIGKGYQGLKCIDVIQYNCGNQGRKRREVSTDIVTQVIDASRRLTNVVDMVDEVFGDPLMYELEGRAWLDQLNLAQDPDTPGGTLLTSEEVDVITGTLNNTAQVETLRQFLWRWNNTMAAWENGTLLQVEGKPGFMNYTAIQARVEQSRADTEAAKKRGYPSVFDYFDGAMMTYKEAERRDTRPEKGVCARVRLRILQELTLTREGFNARLELENGEEGALEGVRVTIEIRDSLSRLSSNHLFAIGALELEGLTGVDGSGTLQSGQKGSAQWLIAPYSTAANVTDTLYDVGGRLQYSVNGQQFNVPLLPDTITVKPNPSLVLHYFHEKFVAGDDPFTSDVIEPSLPFALAVLVTNQAVGVARAVRITSGQPQIIENEKGLLINFRVTGASVQGGPVSPSLAVTLGDIGPGQARVATWQLTCSLKGKFYNFTATFENINPLGDPQLSIMDSVDYHELIHAVRVTASHVGSDATQAPDDLDDFLVNDVIDVDDLPDRLYQSHNGLVSWPVAVAASSLALERQEQRGRRSYKYVTLTAACVNVTHTNFSYSRVVNQVTNSVAMEALLMVTRDDGRDVMVDKNAWLTSYFHDEFYFHLFDSVQDHVDSQRSRLGQADNCTVTYTAVFGPRNLYRPRLNRENLMSPIYVSSRQYSSDLLALSANDTDGDDVTFSLTSATSVPVVVDARTGVVRNTAPLLVGSRFLLTLAVTDDGIPALSDTLDVEMRVGDATNDKTTASVSSSSSSVTTVTTRMTSGESSDVTMKPPTEMTSKVTTEMSTTAITSRVTTGRTSGVSTMTSGATTEATPKASTEMTPSATTWKTSGMTTVMTSEVSTEVPSSTSGSKSPVSTDAGVTTVASVTTNANVGSVTVDAIDATDASNVTNASNSTDASNVTTVAITPGNDINGGSRISVPCKSPLYLVFLLVAWYCFGL